MSSGRSSEPEVWQCDHCSKVYGSQRALERHRRESSANTTNVPFACLSCGSTFKRAENLRRHRDQSKCGRQNTEGTHRKHQIVPAKRTLEPSHDEPLRALKRPADVDQAISTFIGSPFSSIKGTRPMIRPNPTTPPSAQHVLRAIGPDSGNQSYSRAGSATSFAHPRPRDPFEAHGDLNGLLPPDVQLGDEMRRGHGSVVSSSQRGDGNSSELGTRKDSLNCETPMTSLSMSPPSQDGSISTTSWLADPDDQDVHTPPVENRNDFVSSNTETYEQKHVASPPTTVPDPDLDGSSSLRVNSKSLLPRNGSLSLRQRSHRRSHLSLEQGMQRLSVDSSNTWPSVGSLFGNSSGDPKRSLRESIAASISSVARSTHSMRSEGMPGPLLSQVDEELELARQASRNQPSDVVNGSLHPRHDGRTGLFDAIASNDMVQLRQCLATELVNPNALDEGGRTPLILATAHGHDDIVDVLLLRYKKAIDVNLQDPAGCTPLMYACSEGNLVLMKKLLKIAKAQVDVQDKHGDTAIHILASKPDVDADMVSTLLTAGKPNLDLRNHDGRTALHLAALQGHKSAVQTLLRDRRYNPIVQEMLGLKATAGSFVNRQDNAGKTALHLAAASGHSHIVQVLLADGNVNPNRQCPRGMTALMDAVVNCQVASVRIMVHSGKCAELLRDFRGRNALQIAGEIAETRSDDGGDVDLIVKELWEIKPSEVCVEYY